jgi:3-(3-hydroxy-phenyl)propionate hydroxylase
MCAAPVAPVVIVGAGPTGLTAALELAHFGVPSIVLDEGYELAGGSRSLAIHGTALIVWEKLGCAEPMLAKGIAWRTRHTFFREQELYTQVMPAPSPGALPTFINLQQYYTELYLTRRLQTVPLIDLRRGHKVVDVTQDGSAVSLTVDSSHGRYSLPAEYALACDGARSTMRGLCRLEFPGRTYGDRFLIADIESSLPFPREPRFFFDHPASPGYTFLIHPQPDGVWRLDWQVGADVDVEVERRPENVERRIRAVIGDIPYRLAWLSDYRFHQRLLASLRVGRILFLGDAAHLMAPFGARGMNSAIHDVENLGWKLALVLQGRAPEALLDTYQKERWAAQQHNQDVTNATMRFMAPRTAWQRLRRNLVLRMSARWPAARRWVNSGKMFEPFVYLSTPIIVPDDEPQREWIGAPRLGARVPDAVCELVDTDLPPEGRCVELRRLLGSAFVALYFGASASDAEGLAGELLQADLPAPTRLCLVLGDDPGTRPAPSSARREEVRTIRDRSGGLGRLFASRPGTLYLVRPDGHIAARRRRLRPGDLARFVRAGCAIGGAPPIA